MKEPIYILCASDNNYAPYCGIMLTSLFESNRDSEFSVYILVDDGFSEKNKKKFNKLTVKYRNKISVIKLNKNIFENLPLHTNDSFSYITQSTYYRLLAPEIFPKEVNKCIYLDCDIIVDGDIKPLWSIDLSGKAIAGAKDGYSESHHKRMGYPSDYDYINAGVSVYNLNYWRENHIQESVFDYIERNHGQLTLMDQDALNGLLYDKIELIPERYNFQISFFNRKPWQSYSDAYRKHLVEECKDVVIVHYCCRSKPWHFSYSGGFCYSLWEKYRRVSLWRNCRITRPKRKYTKYLIKRILFKSMLRKHIEEEWIILPETKHYFGFGL